MDRDDRPPLPTSTNAVGIGRKRPYGNEEGSNASTGRGGRTKQSEEDSGTNYDGDGDGGTADDDDDDDGRATGGDGDVDGGKADERNGRRGTYGDNDDEEGDVCSNNVDDRVSDGGNEDDSSSSSSSSRGSYNEDQAAMIASLLGGGGNDRAAMIASLLPVIGDDPVLRTFLANYDPDPDLPPPPNFPDGMAEYLLSDECKSIIVLAGAGMSVSCGIPDFRSAGVGLYDTLRSDLLTASDLERALIEGDPTLVLDRGMFMQNPLPMLETKRSFIIGTHEGRWKATLAHRFVEMLHTKLGKLTRLYTQNIDGLEYQTRLPREKVVNVHGSMGAAACELCGHEMDFDDFTEAVRTNIKDITGQDVGAPCQSTPIICEACGNPTVKPTIVLFRSSMPREFHARTAEDLPYADLLIIMGTSLTVAPANSLVYRVPSRALRMVMNDERVGRRLGVEYEDTRRDIWARGYTDVTCLDLAEKIGWLDDLAKIVDELPDSSAQLLRDRLASRRQKEEGEGGKA